MYSKYTQDVEQIVIRRLTWALGKADKRRMTNCHPTLNQGPRGFKFRTSNTKIIKNDLSGAAMARYGLILVQNGAYSFYEAFPSPPSPISMRKNSNNAQKPENPKNLKNLKFSMFFPFGVALSISLLIPLKGEPRGCLGTAVELN